MSNINIAFIFDEILEFMKAHEHDLTEGHHEYLTGCLSFLKMFINVPSIISKYGCHFVNCPWSKNLCQDGPDTCACYLIENRIFKVKKLMLLYGRLK